MLSAQEIDTLLKVMKHAWATGVVCGEGAAAEMVALRMKLEEMQKPKPPELVK